MDDKLILEKLNSGSQEIEEIKKSLTITKGFLDLIKKLDSLPDMSKRSSEESRSLYEAVSKNRDISTMEKQLEGFFGAPRKLAGQSVSFMLRFNPSVRYLGGVQGQQSLFIKKLELGEFYGALWPWQKNPENMTVHIGFCCAKMSDEDYEKLGTLVQEELTG